MIEARFKLDERTARVLDVVKGKHGLKNRNEALRMLAEQHAEEYLDFEPDEKVLKELDEIYEAHVKKHGTRKMTEKELDKLLGL